MVDEIVHAVDPQGDVVLVLRNPNAPFAVWKDSEWVSRPTPSEVEPVLLTHSPDDPSEALSALLSHNTNIDEEPEIKFLLSSRHLILASRYFNTKLNGAWKEATPDPTDRRYHLEASDWDPDALLVLMNVIHGRTRSVPRSIDCEMLAKIAVLVDYYDCHEVVEVFASMWVDALKNQLPSECGRDLVLWLLISYVFQQDDAFAQITKTAVVKGQGPMPTTNLPIPSIVLDLIDWRRQDAVQFILNALNDLRESFLNHPHDDVQSCVSLGALDKAMYREKLLGLREPYIDHSVIDMETIARGFSTPSWDAYEYERISSLSELVASRLNPKFEEKKKGFSLAEAARQDVV
ncbi:hypothetical protein LX36DRAFT_620201 [Colletotrichum falcatum]|nr:hypothetical protein LX36DRAFT_620201 [Colletotrichum falcatum]